LADGIKKKINNVIIDTREKDVKVFRNDLIYEINNKGKRYTAVIASTTAAITKR
jgi:hypothetical protein